jgi:signal transduction histidine kinase
LNAVIERTRVLIEHTVPENIAVEFDTRGSPCPVCIDVSEFEAAVLNVTVNARDAMPHGGRLTFSVHETVTPSGEAALEPRGAPTGAHIELRITDTGHGMAPETLARVYEPFFTTKEAGRGTGLGLSQVYGFAKQSGGHVSISSEVGRSFRSSFRAPPKPLWMTPVRSWSQRNRSGLLPFWLSRTTRRYVGRQSQCCRISGIMC